MNPEDLEILKANVSHIIARIEAHLTPTISELNVTNYVAGEDSRYNILSWACHEFNKMRYNLKYYLRELDKTPEKTGPRLVAYCQTVNNEITKHTERLK